MINRLNEDKAILEARHDVMEDEIDIEDLLKANFGDLTMRDILNLTDVTFPADLIDLDFPKQDLKTEQLDQSVPPSMELRKITSADAEEAVKMLEISKRKVNTKKKKRVPKIKEVSPVKIFKNNNQYEIMKGTKHQANKQPFPREPAALKQLKFSHLESEKLLSSQCISCPHCGKSYQRPSQGKMVEHLSSFHNTHHLHLPVL